MSGGNGIEGHMENENFTLDEMASETHGVFHREGWAFGEYHDPSEQDILDILEQCRVHLVSQSEGTIIEVGNIAVRKDSDKTYEVYVKLGAFSEGD